jgi:excisionase family DNA binding protein
VTALTVEQAAVRLGLTVGGVRRLVQTGTLSAEKLPGPGHGRFVLQAEHVAELARRRLDEAASYARKLDHARDLLKAGSAVATVRKRTGLSTGMVAQLRAEMGMRR